MEARCSAFSRSDCVCERGRTAGSEEATHTLLERDDHLSPGDSQRLGYQVNTEESSKAPRESRLKCLEKKTKKYQAHAQTSMSLQKKITQYDTKNYQKILCNSAVFFGHMDETLQLRCSPRSSDSDNLK